jgi:endonuclease/exonuclease/phosphatase family metal-dependent hydrolase
VSAGAGAESERLRIVTFNAALHPDWFPFVPERRRALIEALAASAADVVALQEVWIAGDRRSIRDGAGFPFVVEPDPLPAAEGFWAAEGASGIMLLSHRRLRSVRILPLPSTLVRRALVVAELEGAVPATVITTHLSADLRQAEHPDPGGWAAEHRRQVDVLVESAASIEGPVILAGDLNCGPARGSLKPELADSYAVLRGGFGVNPYLDQDDPACTWCPDNPLVAFPAPTVIDHVMASGLVPVAAERVFDGPLLVESGTISTRLSDHYGVLAVFGSDSR